MILYPLQKKFKITQKFGNKLINWVEYYKQFGLAWHDWTDFATPIWTPIVACFDWIVEIGNQGDKAYWKYIKLTSDTRQCIYAHLSEFNVREWQKVFMWDVLWKTWNTGWSTWPHLHFWFRSLQDWVILNKNNGFNGYWGVVEKWLTFLAVKVN